MRSPGDHEIHPLGPSRTQEAENTKRFKKLLQPYPEFAVPAVVPQLSSKRVLTTEWMAGVPIDKAGKEMTTSERNRVGSRLLWLSMAELSEFRLGSATSHHSLATSH